MDQDIFQRTNTRAVAMWRSWARQGEDSGGKVGKDGCEVNPK